VSSYIMRLKSTPERTDPYSTCTPFGTYKYVHIVHVDMLRVCLWTAATNGPIVHPPYDIWVWRATVEWYWHGKAKESGQKPVWLSLFPPKFSYGLTRERSRTSSMRSLPLTAWAIARPKTSILCMIFGFYCIFLFWMTFFSFSYVK
jgi:hypothetical protein